MSSALGQSQADNPSDSGVSQRSAHSVPAASCSQHTPQNDRDLFEEVMAKQPPRGATMGHFSRKEKLGRFLWGVVQATVFRYSPRRADAWRASLLRLFGARVGRVKLLRSTVRIEVPWNVAIGDGAQIGDRVYLYSLGPITIGEHTVVSQFCHLCAGTHDYERTDFPLLRVPITIGSRCWIAAESFVGPGVTIGDGVVVGARGGVIRDLPAWRVCVGSPAKPIGVRRLFDVVSGERLDPGDTD